MKKTVFLCVGGDARQIYMGRKLAEYGKVYTYRIYDSSPNVVSLDSLDEMEEKADVLVLPMMSGGDWMYGYKGTGKIDNSQCYIFAVYTYKDDVHIKLGTVAKTVYGSDLYVLNETTGEYEKTQLPDDNSSESTWAETETLAFAKN